MDPGDRLIVGDSDVLLVQTTDYSPRDYTAAEATTPKTPETTARHYSPRDYCSTLQPQRLQLKRLQY